MSYARDVLIVEDEPAIRDPLRLHLGLARFEIKEAADGRRGLDMARAERFDVVILDVMLPGLDASRSAAPCGPKAPAATLPS